MNDPSNLIRNLGEGMIWKGVGSSFWDSKLLTIFLKSTESVCFTVSCTVVYYLTR